MRKSGINKNLYIVVHMYDNLLEYINYFTSKLDARKQFNKLIKTVFPNALKRELKKYNADEIAIDEDNTITIVTFEP